MKCTAVEAALHNCDECGKPNTRIWRTENNHRYCGNCYARVFKLRMCPSCDSYARLNKYDSNAICQACVRAKPCARCGKTDYQTGKLTPYGMVCNACAPHFREKQPCEVCGKNSNRLTRVTRLGHNLRVCPKCARADFATCAACRHYRLLSLSDDGRMLCDTCKTVGEITCTKCHQSMPAGRGKECEACYWQRLLEKRTTIDCAAFKLSAMAEYFQSYAVWLGLDVGAHKAAITLHRYLPFFLETERQFNGIPEYEALLQYFGAAKLRKVLLPMRWMDVCKIIVVDKIAREANTEHRRISALLKKVIHLSMPHKLLMGYHRLLEDDFKREKTTLRSIRLALLPAVSLLLVGAKMKEIPPNQKVLDAYLQKTPGQRAAVSGFVNYLRDVHNVDVKLPKLNVKKNQLNRQKKLEAEMLELMKAGRDKASDREWLSLALAYFHGLPKKIGKTIAFENIINTNDGGIEVIWSGRRYWLKAN